MSNLIGKTVVGRLGADPEEGITPSGSEYVRFNVAVNQYNKDTKAEETVWVKCTAWDRNREYVLAHLKKGKGEMVWVTGDHTVYEGTSGKQDQLKVRAIGIAGNFAATDADDGEDW